MSAFFSITLTLLAVFLILLVLVQRGRGGGLAGALGGMGGSSAFGAKAGDVFTRITIITASIWIALSLTAQMWATHKGDAFGRVEAAAPASNMPVDLAPQRERADATGPAAAPSPPAASSTPPATSAPVTTAPAASEAAPATNGAAPPAQTE